MIHPKSERTYFISCLEKVYEPIVLPIELVKSVEFYCAGIAYLLRDWILRGMKEKPETLTQWLCDFAPDILLKAIK